MFLKDRANEFYIGKYFKNTHFMRTLKEKTDGILDCILHTGFLYHRLWIMYASFLISFMYKKFWNINFFSLEKNTVNIFMSTYPGECTGLHRNKNTVKSINQCLINDITSVLHNHFYPFLTPKFLSWKIHFWVGLF